MFFVAVVPYSFAARCAVKPLSFAAARSTTSLRGSSGVGGSRMSSVAGEVSSHFRRMDDLAASAAAAAGIGCPPGCGKCCTSPFVEATECEMAPLAAALVREGRAQAVLDRIHVAAESNDPTCVVFERSTPDGALGRCSEYEHRPGLCRLFGFSGRVGPNGTNEWNACRVMRESGDAADRALSKPPPASMPILSNEISQLRGSCGAPDEQIPMLLNDALRRAITRTLMRSMYESECEGGVSEQPSITATGYAAAELHPVPAGQKLLPL